MVLTKFWNFICLKRVATVSTIVFILRTNQKYQGHCTCLLVMVLFLWWNRSLYKNAIIFRIDEFSYYILSDMPGGICSTYNAFEIEKSLLKRKKATFRFYFILFLCICIPAAAVVCVTLIDRLKGDQLNTPTEILRKWEQRPFTVIVEFIKEQLKISSWKNGDAS